MSLSRRMRPLRSLSPLARLGCEMSATELHARHEAFLFLWGHPATGGLDEGTCCPGCLGSCFLARNRED